MLLALRCQACQSGTVLGTRPVPRYVASACCLTSMHDTQVLCGVALAGALAVCAYGILQGAPLAQRCSWCPRVACVSTDWWTCTSAAPLAGKPACSFSPLPNARGKIDCPSVRRISQAPALHASSIRALLFNVSTDAGPPVAPFASLTGRATCTGHLQGGERCGWH